MTELQKLISIENEAWDIMMNGSEVDSCTIKGKEGKNYIAWCKAADAERNYRKANGVGYE